MPPLACLRVGRYEHFIYPGEVVTCGPGSLRVAGVPHDTADYEARARAQGYPNGAAMNQSHDLAHLLVAALLGVECPVMISAYYGTGESALTGAAEDAAMALERLANMMGVSLSRAAANLK